MLLKKISILFITTILLIGCKEASIEERYPDLKDLQVNLDTLSLVFNEVKSSEKEGSFSAFVIGANDEEAINIQFSFEDGHVGLDWVLLGDVNIRDQLKYEMYLTSHNIAFDYKTRNNVSYIRTRDGNLALICRNILVDLYGVKKGELFDVYYQGINLEKYVQQVN